jgi:hypothetical protein
LTGKKPLNGYLDHLRENVEVLDEQIENARRMSKQKDPTALQWAKTLRDLVELRNTTLEKIKLHLLGRDPSYGWPTEPPSQYDNDPEIMFERDFRSFLAPWKESDLKLECEECHKSREDVEYRDMGQGWQDEYICVSCYNKFQSEQRKQEPGTRTETKDVNQTTHVPSKGDINSILQSVALQIKVLRTFPADQRIVKLQELLAEKPEVAPGMEPAWEAYRSVLQKELENAKAQLGS